MLKNFSYSFPTQIIFGSEATQQLSSLIKVNKFSRVLLVYGGGSTFENGSYEDVVKQLKTASVQYIDYPNCPTNPDINYVKNGVKLVADEKIDLVLAIGGGSVIDASKAIALFSKNQTVPNFWKHMITKQYLNEPALPIGVVLTSFGTGSEGNGSFVISNYQTNEKIGQSDLSVRPAFAICDPKYTLTLKKNQVAFGSVDTVSHLLEQYFCLESDNFLNSIIESLIITTVKNSLVAHEDSNNLEAKSELMLTSTFALSYFLSLGKTLDWSAHKIEHALSGVYQVPHAAGLACIFPAWLELASENEVLKKKLFALGMNMGIIKQSDHGSLQKVTFYFRDYFHKLGLTTNLTKLVGDDIDIKKITDIALKYGTFGNIFPIDQSRCEQLLKIASKSV